MSLFSLMQKGFRYFTNAAYRFDVNSYRGLHNNMSDENFIRKSFRVHVGYNLNLNHPKTFNEKLQWLKLNNRRPEYTMMVDKYEVKSYIAEKIGKQYIVPTYGVWNCFDDIDFQMLPDQFVLKCTHDSGGHIIVKDKATMDYKEAKAKLSKCLNRNYYYLSREWPYKNIKPRIIAEKYLKSKTELFDEAGAVSPCAEGLIDYKFYCFNGMPLFLYISKGLGGDHKLANMNFVDLDWNKTPFQRNDFMPFKELPPKPHNFSQMVEIASCLSQEIPFVRIDLYSVDDAIYFSEFTFCPGGGDTPFSPQSWERKVGDWIVLPTDKEG